MSDCWRSFWPFRLDKVTKELADESDSKVTAGSFHATYFPYPGCVLEQVIFQHNPKAGTPPLIAVKEDNDSGHLHRHFCQARETGSGGRYAHSSPAARK